MCLYIQSVNKCIVVLYTVIVISDSSWDIAWQSSAAQSQPTTLPIGTTNTTNKTACLQLAPQIQLGALGECCKLPSCVWGGSPADIEYGAFLTLKMPYVNSNFDNIDVVLMEKSRQYFAQITRTDMGWPQPGVFQRIVPKEKANWCKQTWHRTALQHYPNFTYNPTGCPEIRIE